MINKKPIIVEVTRGTMVESRHLIHGVVCNALGHVVYGWGDLDLSIYPRSAIKPMQAIPLLETGAADAASASEAEIAFACASHNGEHHHVNLANNWLERLGLDHQKLECIGHVSHELETAYAQVKSGEKITNAHNNCSGKHSGFLATAYHMGETLEGYIAKDHPVQERLLRVLTELGGCDLLNTATGIDGCGIPVMAMPLSALALAAARMSAPDSLGLERAVACKRIISAMMAYPYNVAGQNRFDTNIMAVGKGMFATKTGAEGVHVGMFVKSGYGVAIKCEDGAKRATDVAMANIVNLLGCLDEVGQMCVAQHLRTTLNNAAGLSTGEIRMRVDWRD
jgi:L-asparaginase II